jgi:hypothetical protein
MLVAFLAADVRLIGFDMRSLATKRLKVGPA